MTGCGTFPALYMREDQILIDLQNSQLRILAIVEAQMSRGIERPSEYLLPLLQSVISRREGDIFNVEDTVTLLEEEFCLEIPVYLVESLKPALIKLGAIEWNSTHSCFLCRSTMNEIDEPDLDQSHFDLLEERLVSFAKNHRLDAPLASSSWQQALTRFFSSNPQQNIGAKKVRNKIIGNAKEKDDWLISKFIFHMQKCEPPVFDLIKRIYVAYSIADTISSFQHMGHKEDWDDLSIVYDSTVLMRLLGTSGALLKKATEEMHNLLVSLGCQTHYFAHNLSELMQNIEAITQRYKSGAPVHRETAHALERGEATIATINLLKADADLRLGKLGITQLDLSDRNTNFDAQINPKHLEDYLKSKINYRSSAYAAEVDAESIEKIIFLRRTRREFDLPKSKFVFVTHNAPFAKYGAKFCVEHCGYTQHHAPPIVSLNTLTRLAWLASDNGGKRIDLTNELIINCFRASLPDDKWFSKFWSTIENSNPELLDMNTYDSLYLLDVRNIAEELSLGSSALLDEVDIAKAIQNAKQNEERRQAEHQEEIERERKQSQEALSFYLAEADLARRAAEREVAMIQETAAAEAQREKERLEEVHRTEIERIEHQQLISIRWAVERTKQEIMRTLEERSSRHAMVIVRSLTGTLGVGFALLSFAVATGKADDVLWPTMKTPAVWITATLGAFQALGFFVPSLSFLFVGEALERWLAALFKDRYMASVSDLTIPEGFASEAENDLDDDGTVAGEAPIREMTNKSTS